ncbi:EFR1 family ferrodoxin [Pelosinus propionicus]|uniref:4Fe-4S dicluster domain-containing protein n=1 Tax=Pelosinus propionicus DSM 13327 TaxID=1123291 RepID=A0A1I4MXV6_9FIRM|nr:EFR1 family ferrodoxin [Pelosinus propionicus]SFM08048.1 4Fe-4S dicluster domain-containing protein [Pelosinus propionicus DSM 13327]
MFETIVLFFMTGTGNSYQVAAWFAEKAAALGVEVQMQQIKRANLSLEPKRSTLCVFAFPTHGFTAPWLLLKQILCLPRGKGTAAAILPLRAGTRIKGISFPGMEGTAGYLAACLLLWKGYRVKGVLGIDMPSNWTAVHWGLSKENTEFIIAAAEPKVKHFANVILNRQVYFDGIVPFLIGLWLAPISVMYLLLGQLMLSKLFFASDKCISCRKCAKLCPKQAIIMAGSNRKRPYWTYSCDSCMACMNYCPYGAVEVSPIIGILFYFIGTIPISTYILSHFVPLPLSWLPISWSGIIQYIYILISVFLAYRLLHTALGWRFFSMFLSKLSHTRYFRRYHAPNINVKDFILSYEVAVDTKNELMYDNRNNK